MIIYFIIEDPLYHYLQKKFHTLDFGNNVAKICIPYSANNTTSFKEGYEELLEEAGPKPPSIISENRPTGAPPCTVAILSILNEHTEISRNELREILIATGYKPATILNALRSLEKNPKKQLLFIGSSNSPKQIIKLNIDS